MREVRAATAIAGMLLATGPLAPAVAQAQAQGQVSARGGYAPAAAGAPLTDTCVAYRKPFQDLDNHARTGAIMGGVGGFLTGLLIVGLTHQKGGQAVGTIAATTAAGSALGFVQAKRGQARDQAQLQAMLSDQMSPEMAKYSRLGQDLANLGNCRRTQIYDVRTQYVAHQLGQSDALARVSLIRGWAGQDDELVSKAAQLQNAAVSDYAKAYGVAEGMQESDVGDGSTVIQQVGYQNAAYTPAVETVVGDRASYGGGATAYDAAPAEPAVPAPLNWFAKAPHGAPVHTAPNADTLLGAAPFGSSVAVLGPAPTDPAWFKVSFHGAEGYVRGEQLSATEPTQEATSAGRRRKAHRAAPVQIAAAAPPRQPTGPVQLRVKPITVAASTPKQRFAAALGAKASLQQVRALNNAKFNEAISDTERMIGRV